METWSSTAQVGMFARQRKAVDVSPYNGTENGMINLTRSFSGISFLSR